MLLLSAASKEMPSHGLISFESSFLDNFEPIYQSSKFLRFQKWTQWGRRRVSNVKSPVKAQSPLFMSQPSGFSINPNDFAEIRIEGGLLMAASAPSRFWEITYSPTDFNAKSFSRWSLNCCSSVDVLFHLLLLMHRDLGKLDLSAWNTFDWKSCDQPYQTLSFLSPG